MDGVILNIPGYLAGLPQEAYITEFVPAVTEEPVDDEVPGGEDDLIPAPMAIPRSLICKNASIQPMLPAWLYQPLWKNKQNGGKYYGCIVRAEA